MNFLPLVIGLRYFRAKRRSGFISLISAISMAGLTLGVTALIVVLSVMNGFEREVRDRILGVVPHGFILSDQPVAEWQGIQQGLLAHPQILAAMPFIEANGMLASGNRDRPSIIKGLDPTLAIESSILEQHMTYGSLADLEPGAWGIVMGDILASRLGLIVGDQVTVMVPEVSVSMAGIHPRMRRFTLVGVFSLGAEMDSGLAITHYQDLGRLLRYPDQAVDGIEVRVDDIFAARSIVRQAASQLQLSGRWFTQDWTATQGSLFQAIAMEKRMVGLLLVLIIAVAAFNIISSLVMLVTDKQGDIAILRTMGARRSQIMQVFIVQGTTVGFIGVSLGVVLGIIGALTIADIVAFVESLLGMNILNSDVYFINFLPSELRANDVIRIGIFSFFVSVLATLYPAWRASRMLPSEALRHE